ncbi:transcriptional regulator [Synergistales bacterium]|nr:transcriptional regulator [Synergistales bacterium]
MLNRKLFVERLRVLREQRQITIVDVADALGLKKQSIHQWETTKTLPSADKLIELADYFDVPIDYLVGRSDDPVRR